MAKKRRKVCNMNPRSEREIDTFLQLRLSKAASQKRQMSSSLARLSTFFLTLSSAFTWQKKEKKEKKTSSPPSSTAAAREKTHQTKAHGGCCGFLTALVQHRRVCHSASGRGIENSRRFSADQCSPVSGVVHCVQRGRASEVA